MLQGRGGGGGRGGDEKVDRQQVEISKNTLHLRTKYILSPTQTVCG